MNALVYTAELIEKLLTSLGMFICLVIGSIAVYAAYRKFEHVVYMWDQLPMETTDEGRVRVEANKARFGKHLSRTGRRLFCACIGCPNRVSARYSDRLCYKCVCEKADWRGSL